MSVRIQLLYLAQIDIKIILHAFTINSILILRIQAELGQKNPKRTCDENKLFFVFLTLRSDFSTPELEVENILSIRCLN